MGPEALAFLFCIALCAGVVDGVAGGGGLITLPALLMVGLTPVQAIATNKIQALSSVASAASRFIWAGSINFRMIWTKVFASSIGAAIGACLVQTMDSHILSYIAPVLLIAIALVFLFSRNPGQKNANKRVGETGFTLLVALPIGFYDGFFGPGTGSMYIAAFVLLLGRNLPSATAETKILNTAGSAIAAVIFLSGGAIVWKPALVMTAGAFIGGQLGAHIALKGGARLIRVVLVIISTALAVKLLLSHQ
jgi:hypothetical protein